MPVRPKYSNDNNPNTLIKKYIIVVAILLSKAAWTQAPVNYVRSWEARIPITDASTMNTRPVTEVMQTTAYIDGLGRPLQTVIKEGSFMNSAGSKTDMVTYFEYDELGREVKKYLPYAAATGNGNIKTSPVSEQSSFYNSQLTGQGENYFYSFTNMEASPLNRPTVSYAPGASWYGSSRGVAINYLNNTTADDVKIWTVNSPGSYSLATINGNNFYGIAQLIKTVTTDEQGSQVVEYKDKDGKLILKKVQADATPGNSYSGWLCTYYVYDDYNNLRLVIQPKGVKELTGNGWQLNNTIMDELCFRYEYDTKNRMRIKKVPGAAEVYMIYDKWDRLALTQDGNMRSSNKWLFTKYDYLNRPVMTGFYTDAIHTGQPSMQTFVDGLMITAGRFETTDGSANGYTSTASFPAISNPALLSISFYDNYNWTTNNYTGFTSMNTDNNSLFYTAGAPLYAQPLTPSNKTKNLLTGSITYILNSSAGQKLVSSIFYDDRGRAIQSKAQNITTGTDITTTQYNFTGQPLMSVLQTEKAGGTTQSIKLVTKMNYDDLGRLQEIKKKITQTVGGNTVPASPVEKTIVKNEYDKLGQLVTKTLAPGFNSNAGLEQLNYNYNIRGWLTSLNKDYLNGTSPAKYFGMELAYDKTGSVVSGTGYTSPQYNGNIAGVIWKSRGDGVYRQYNFGYDKLNRLMKAGFIQKNEDNSWNNSIVDYSIKMGDGSSAASAYDENGNIKQMQQWGLKLSGSSQIDNLSYNYGSTGLTNKLLKVTDSNNDPDTKLGDFKDGSNADDDYSYDVNGNLILDKNKNISSISYNHLNLPGQITVTGKGDITYTYDAAGNKLKKVTVDNTVTPSATTTTLYLGGAVYENDELQFTGHEEGRVRPVRDGSNNITSFAYDYYIKDHLGNIRMVLTDEQQTNMYPAATMEEATAATEETFYGNLPETRVSTPSDYPPDSPTGNERVAKVTGTIWGGYKIGPSIALKVMAGDRFNVQVNSWYKMTKGQTVPPPTGIITELLAALNNAIGAVAGNKATALELNSSNVLSLGVNTFITNQAGGSSSTRPRAYLNWILFDEQFNLVNSSSGFEQVPEESYFNNGSFPNNNTKLHVFNNMSVSKNGFLYIYVSNETPNIDVFFDNLQVTHLRGAILETNNFYQYGLIQSGISSKAAGALENKEKTFQGQRFDDDLGVDVYSFKYRNEDRQTGRFWQIDPLADKYVHNSTYAFSENKVTTHVELEGLEGVRYDEFDDNGKLSKINIEKNVVVLSRSSNSENSDKKNKKIEKRNENKISRIKKELNSYFNGANGVKNSDGVKVEFKFNVVGVVDKTENIKSDKGRDLEYQRISSEYAIMGKAEMGDKEGNPIMMDRPVGAAVITNESPIGFENQGEAGAYGIIRANLGPGVIPHEVLHTLEVPDNGYNQGGLLGRPPGKITAEEVDKVISKSIYKK